MATVVDDINKQDALLFTEVGYSGLKQSGGFVLEDPTPKLRSLHERIRAFAEMRNDPVVGAVLFAIEQFTRGAEWSVDPADDSEDARRNADFLAENMAGLSHTWQDFVSEALTMLPFGFCVVELVYKALPDGRIAWKKLPSRSQETVWKWEFDENGGLRGVWQLIQWAPGSRNGLVFIPVEKLLLFRTTTTKQNPEGSSVLRSSWRPYYAKKRLEIIEAIGIERDLAGYPVLYVPDELFMNSAEAKKKLQLAIDIVTRIRKDENMGAVMPASWQKAGGLSLLSSSASRTIDTDKVIQRYDVRIAMSVLADVVLMGHENAGSYAMAEVKRGLLGDAMKTWLDIITDVLNRHAVPRLFALNGIREKLPEIVHGPVVAVDPQTLANIIFRLAGVDALRTGPRLRKALRKLLGLPEEESDDLEDAQALLQAKERDAIGRALAGRSDNETRPAPA